MSPKREQRPALPTTVITVLNDHAEAMADAVVARVQAGSPEIDITVPIADPVTIRNLRLGARIAVGCFLERISSANSAPDTALFVAHGRAQQIAGRPLDELLSFYRLGGLAMWQYAEERPESKTLSTEDVFRFGRQMLGLVDELSVAAVQGYTDQGAETMRAEMARRERLHSLLLSDRPSSREDLEVAASAANWQMPDRLRVAVAALPIDPPPGSSAAGPSRVLSGSIEGGRRALVVQDDDETEQWLLRTAKAMSLVMPLSLGPSVEPHEAALSADRAASLLNQVGSGVLSAKEFVRCDDHDVDLLLVADPDLARSVTDRCLEPINRLSEAQREKMLETLSAWLADPGRPQAMADRLDLHVQTIRYRMRQLREIFGDTLDDPEARFEFALALRSNAALSDTK